MLSIVNSGGDIESFLEDKKKHMRTAKQEQELTLETLELFGEMYMTLSLFPLLLIIIMVVMKMIPNANVTDQMLYMVVYGLIPMIGVGFLVLVSTVKHDEPGDGYLSMGNTSQRTETGQKGGLLSLGLVEQLPASIASSTGSRTARGPMRHSRCCGSHTSSSEIIRWLHSR